MRRLQTSDWIILALLLVLGVLGRWNQPAWNFTPLAAIALFSGFYFRRAWLAAVVPMVALAVSNLVLPAHTNWLVPASVYACLAVPAVIGKWLPTAGSLRRRLPAWLVGVVAPSAVFFVVTNLAVWVTSSQFPMTAGGLAECYAAALPFYRSMLAGDLFWTTLLFGSWVWATSGQRQLAREIVR